MRQSRTIILQILVAAMMAGGCFAASASAQTPCVDVVIGTERTPNLGCLNDVLRHSTQAERNRQTQASAAASAGVPTTSNELGLFNEAATAERLGDSFGKSVSPQRPARSFGNPLQPR
ncbi:MAG TPA: hypothetical protein VM689_05515 [Aliidongia sp.]|nr:hypothetical protein [Aliidongia sp.]